MCCCGDGVEEEKGFEVASLEKEELELGVEMRLKSMASLKGPKIVKLWAPTASSRVGGGGHLLGGTPASSV